jgi:hypothetical protein
MADEPLYDEWIAKRRAAEPSPELVDLVMAAVEDRDVQPSGFLRLADRMNNSRAACCAVCLASLLVGILPFLFVAQVAYLLEF